MICQAIASKGVRQPLTPLHEIMELTVVGER